MGGIDHQLVAKLFAVVLTRSICSTQLKVRAVHTYAEFAFDLAIVRDDCRSER